MDAETRRQALLWRGIRPHERVCNGCDGSGRRMYGSTATWRGGMGGAAMTIDVCDVCWGSGSLDNPGLDLRNERDTEAHRIATEAMKHLCRRAGVDFKTSRLSVVEIATELEKLARSRKQRPEWFSDMCSSLAKALREGVADREEYERIVKENRR